MAISHEEDLSPDDRGHLATCFRDHFGQIRYLWAQLPWRCLALAEGELGGHLGILKRTVCVGDVELMVAGLGGVTTHENLRERGIASAMLERAASFTKNDLHADFGLLICRDEVYPSTPSKDGQLLGAQPFSTNRPEWHVSKANHDPAAEWAAVAGRTSRSVRVAVVSGVVGWARDGGCQALRPRLRCWNSVTRRREPRRCGSGMKRRACGTSDASPWQLTVSRRACRRVVDRSGAATDTWPRRDRRGAVSSGHHALSGSR